jgi:thiol-disulfide isomerase/thioredoxin
MKKIILTVFINVVIMLNVHAQVNYHITGTIERKGIDKVFLYDPSSKIIVDSAIVMKGTFEMKGSCKSQIVAMLMIKTPPSVHKIILDNGEYNIKLDSYLKGDVESTSINHNLWKNYSKSDELKSNIKSKDSLLAVYVLQIEKGNYKLSAQYLAKYHEIQLRLLNFYKKMVDDHPDSYIIPYLLKGLAILTQENFGSTFDKLSLGVRNNQWGLQVKDLLEKNTTEKPDRNQFYFTMLGSNVIPVESKLENGDNFELASLKGKWVFLDFWASWCAPCRAEMPFLVKAYDQFKDKNFVISSVSVDKDKAAWQKALQEDKTSQFIHTNIADFGKTEACKYYQVNAIPANMLISPEGRIIAMDLRGDELIKTLTRVIK